MPLATCLTHLAYLGCVFLLYGQKIGLSYTCSCQFLPCDISLPWCMVAKLVRKVARSMQQHGTYLNCLILKQSWWTKSSASFQWLKQAFFDRFSSSRPSGFAETLNFLLEFLSFFSKFWVFPLSFEKFSEDLVNFASKFVFFTYYSYL